MLLCEHVMLRTHTHAQIHTCTHTQAQIPTPTPLVTQPHHLKSRNRESLIGHLSGFSWIFRLLCIHVICNYKTYPPPQTRHQTAFT